MENCVTGDCKDTAPVTAAEIAKQVSGAVVTPAETEGKDGAAVQPAVEAAPVEVKDAGAPQGTDGTDTK